MLNQARLKVLKVREDHVRNVLDEARKRLGEITHDSSKYKEILQLLILQGLYQVQNDFTVILIRFILHLYYYRFIYFFTTKEGIIKDYNLQKRSMYILICS